MSHFFIAAGVHMTGVLNSYVKQPVIVRIIKLINCCSIVIFRAYFLMAVSLADPRNGLGWFCNAATSHYWQWLVAGLHTRTYQFWNSFCSHDTSDCTPLTGTFGCIPPTYIKLCPGGFLIRSFTGQMPFLSPYWHCQSTEAIRYVQLLVTT